LKFGSCWINFHETAFDEISNVVYDKCSFITLRFTAIYSRTIDFWSVYWGEMFIIVEIMDLSVEMSLDELLFGM
jgi:hypothetical protein